MEVVLPCIAKSECIANASHVCALVLMSWDQLCNMLARLDGYCKLQVVFKNLLYQCNKVNGKCFL